MPEPGVRSMFYILADRRCVYQRGTAPLIAGDRQSVKVGPPVGYRSGRQIFRGVATRDKHLWLPSWLIPLGISGTLSSRVAHS